MKLLNKSHIRLSRYTMLAVLLLLSFVVTSSSLAYWSTYVEASNDTYEQSFQVGSALNSNVDLTSNYDANGNAVLGKTIMPGVKKSNDYHDVTLVVTWDEEASLMWGTVNEGTLIYSYELILSKDGSELSQKNYDKVIKYIHINESELNTSSITHGDTEHITYRVEIDRPSNRGVRQLLKKVVIEVVIHVTLNVE